VTEALELARDLIRCPSVTPAEGGALALLGERLAARGFAVERVVFTDTNTPDIDNLFARIGAGGPHLAFGGHTDVVPAGDAGQWTRGPFAGEIADGKLWGRGAVDMKGGIAAFAAATFRFLDRHGPPKGTISFLITGDEEGPAVNGTVKLLKWAAERGERFDHAIVGEPTNVEALGDTVKVGRRGSFTATVTVVGKQGHVAYPERADNPVPRLAKLAAALSFAPLDRGTDVFQASNLEVVGLKAGAGATNVIPGSASLTFNVRFNDLWTLATLETELRRRLDETGIAYEFAPARGNSSAFRAAPGPFLDLVVAAVTDVTGRVPALTTGGGTSDARFVKDYCPVVEVGLVGRTMHMVDENVPLDELEGLTDVYAAILERYFGVSKAPGG
jgi:succinyl-diaminopimelate desuccinylase